MQGRKNRAPVVSKAYRRSLLPQGGQSVTRVTIFGLPSRRPAAPILPLHPGTLTHSRVTCFLDSFPSHRHPDRVRAIATG